MRARLSARQNTFQQGFSLVELMVAMLIGLILIAGVIQIFLGSNQTYRFTEGSSRVQENARFALDTLQRELRMAGYRGCTRNITSWLDVPAGSSWEDLIGGAPVTGWEATGSAPGNQLDLPATAGWANGTAAAVPATIPTARLPGSDILVINAGQVLDLQATATQNASSAEISLTSANNLAGDAIVLAIAGDCSGGDLWQKQNAPNSTNLSRGSGGAPGNTAPQSTPFANLHGEETQFLAFRSTAYYLASNPAGQPALYRVRLDPAGGAAEEVVEGVESMQVLYGVDLNGNRQVDEYRTALQVTDWQQVVSVRVGLLFRTPEESAGELDSRQYDVIGTRINPVDDRRLRKVAVTTVALRNRLP